MKEVDAPYHLQLGLFLLVVLLLFVFVRPLITVLLTSILLTFIFYPVYLWLRARLPWSSVSILVTLLLIMLLFLLPFAVLVAQIPAQADDVLSFVKGNVLDQNVLSTMCMQGNSFMCSVQSILNEYQVNYDSFFRDPALKFAADLATQIVGSIPILLANIGLVLFFAYYMFRDGPKMVDGLMDLMPLKPNKRKMLLDDCKASARLVVYSNLVVAFAQGAAGAVGFWILGVPSPILWGLLMGILAMFPVVGAALVWAPVAVVTLVGGLFSGAQSEVIRGVLLLVYGVLVISTIDNIIRAKIADASGKVHPLTLFVGIIGGTELFGIIGLFIGPVILSLALTFVKDFSRLYTK